MVELFELSEFDGHEQVTFVSDQRSGLTAIIAIHNTHLGPGLGGCRIWNYQDDASAVRDVLRLSRGMTYKSAVADLPFGGGKSVILLGPGQSKTREMMISMGRAINKLGGHYIAGEDVGSTPEDMETMLGETPHILGAPESAGGSGDPSPLTAFGCFVGIEISVRHRLGADSLEGTSVAVQGLGKVGFHLCKFLYDAGVDLVVYDIEQGLVDEAVRKFGATTATSGTIHSMDTDIFAPCAFGSCLTDETIPQIRACIVAGAANNQLSAPELGAMLTERNILYAPDYVLNAGGVIQLAMEHAGGGLEEATERVRRIGETLTDVYALATAEKIATNTAADRIASARLRT